MAALRYSCKTHKRVFSKQKYYNWWVSLFPKLPVVFFFSLLQHLFFFFFFFFLFWFFLFSSLFFYFYLRLKYLISKKPFEFGRVFDKWKPVATPCSTQEHPDLKKKLYIIIKFFLKFFYPLKKFRYNLNQN